MSNDHDDAEPNTAHNPSTPSPQRGSRPTLREGLYGMYDPTEITLWIFGAVWLVSGNAADSVVLTGLGFAALGVLLLRLFCQLWIGHRETNAAYRRYQAALERARTDIEGSDRESNRERGSERR